MTLEDFVHSVESRLLGLGRLIWRPDPQASVLEELDRNEAQARARRQELASAESEAEALQRRISDRRAAADLLAAEVEAASARGEADRAWRLALDLDRVRQELARDECQIPRLEQLVWSLKFTVRQLERRRTELEARVRV